MKFINVCLQSVCMRHMYEAHVGSQGGYLHRVVLGYNVMVLDTIVAVLFQCIHVRMCRILLWLLLVE